MTLETTIKEFKDCQSKIQSWRKIHRVDHFADITRLEKAMEKIYTNHTTILIDYRRTKNERYLEKAEQVLLEGIAIVKKFSKFELLATLSKGKL
jgi:hypothetical protein|tara:strand:- start:368 stop:649 length:282 start_codon:yes stop_codon:yes gene_type:complete